MSFAFSVLREQDPRRTQTASAGDPFCFPWPVPTTGMEIPDSSSPTGGSTTGGQRPPLRRDGAGVGTSIARPSVFGNEALVGGRPMVGPTTEDGTPWPPLQGEVSPPPAAVTEGYVPSPAGERLWARGAKNLPRLPGGASPRMPCRLNSNLHTKAGGSPKFCFTASNVRPGPGGLQSADSNRHPL